MTQLTFTELASQRGLFGGSPDHWIGFLFYEAAFARAAPGRLVQLRFQFPDYPPQNTDPPGVGMVAFWSGDVLDTGSGTYDTYACDVVAADSDPEAPGLHVVTFALTGTKGFFRPAAAASDGWPRPMKLVLELGFFTPVGADIDAIAAANAIPADLGGPMLMMPSRIGIG